MRGQAVGQAFMFMLAVVIFSMVLLYGYRAITKITQTQEDVSLIRFRDVLASDVERIALKPGSVKRVDVNLPSKYQTVCFIDIDRCATGDDPTCKNALTNEYPIIWQSISSGDPQNVFFIPMQEAKIELEDMIVEEGYFCIDNKGGPISLRLRGIGGKVAMSGWETA